MSIPFLVRARDLLPAGSWRRTSVAPVASRALVTIAALAAPVGATVTNFWREAPIPDAALTDSSGADLHGYRCFDLMITLDPGDDWLSTRIFCDPTGPIFQHALGDFGANFNPPNPAIFPFYPALEFDSFLDGPEGGPLVVTATHDGINDLPPPGIFNTDQVGVGFADAAHTTTGGTFRILRLTFAGPLPTAVGTVYTANSPNGVPLASPIPEPAMLGTLALGACLVVGRHTRRPCSR